MDNRQQTELIIVTREDVAAIKTNVENLCKSFENLCKSFEAHQVATNKRLCDLEQKPARRWESLITALFSAAIAAVVAFFTKRN